MWVFQAGERTKESKFRIPLKPHNKGSLLFYIIMKLHLYFNFKVAFQGWSSVIFSDESKLRSPTWEGSPQLTEEHFSPMWAQVNYWWWLVYSLKNQNILLPLTEVVAPLAAWQRRVCIYPWKEWDNGEGNQEPRIDGGVYICTWVSQFEIILLCWAPKLATIPIK